MKDVLAVLGAAAVAALIVYAALAPTKCAPAHHYIAKPLVITPPIK